MRRILQCAVCGAPFIYEERKLPTAGDPMPEEIPCAYNSHIAGSDLTDGWWQPFAMSPDDQHEWHKDPEVVVARLTDRAEV